MPRTFFFDYSATTQLGLAVRDAKQPLVGEVFALLAWLDKKCICVSSGSAFSTGKLEPSHVFVALGRRTRENSLMHFSLGRDSTAEEADFFWCFALNISAGTTWK